MAASFGSSSPSKALTLEQATAVLMSAKSSPLNAYVVLSLMTGVRTEEARALRWDHVVAWTEDDGWQPVTTVGFDHKRFAIYVWRSVREHGDTKTSGGPYTASSTGGFLCPSSESIDTATMTFH